MLERPSTTERYTRGLAAAVIAVAGLVLAANVGPARAEEPTPVQGQHGTPITEGTAASGTRAP
ncbi:hypothetical protein M2271_006060 [Streptomyces sp. LBL]|uniref:hypothetical protein n=1 Tax=Streptomyces sp. LBL TaxID=2940562 RepID=UPI0024739B62|nr:hypothetical protein [Streptomyces sp. LBL]MDH6628228.1 hypothetical protein [Streptomyces sp. LBL]